MTEKVQHRGFTFKYAFAYAGTLALVASAAIFPSASVDVTLSSLRGLVFSQESSYAQSGVRTQEMSRSSFRMYSAWVVLLALIGACIASSGYKAPHPCVHFRTVFHPFQLAFSREHILPLIRGPSL